MFTSLLTLTSHFFEQCKYLLCVILSIVCCVLSSSNCFWCWKLRRHCVFVPLLDDIVPSHPVLGHWPPAQDHEKMDWKLSTAAGAWLWRVPINVSKERRADPPRSCLIVTSGQAATNWRTRSRLWRLPALLSTSNMILTSSLGPENSDDFSITARNILSRCGLIK